MLQILHNVDMKPYNTMGISVMAREVVLWDDLRELSRWIKDNIEPCGNVADKLLVLGGGSNMLFVGDIDRTVLVNTDHSVEFEPCVEGSTECRAGAGAALDGVCRRACEAGLWGLEQLSLIPGTVGGAAVQNAGAYGADMSGVVSRVTALDIETGCIVELEASQLDYGYRTSLFKQPCNRGRYFIASVTLKLSSQPPAAQGRNGQFATPLEAREHIIATRRAKLPDPVSTGSAGSFFKNPVVDGHRLPTIIAAIEACGIDTSAMPQYPGAPGHVKLSAAWLIDRAGFKGFSMAGAGTWPTQPLVLVNATGEATGSEILELATHISRDIASRFKVTLVPEVEIIRK